jgi:predicted branched-subunit amino acid permease
MIEGFTAPDLKQARAQGFQVALAVSLYGVSFGALSVALGFTLWQTMVLSLVMFSGASQFAFIGVVATGGLSAIPAAIATSGLLGARNSLYALTMSPIIGKGFFRRALAAHLTVDETTAVATAQTGRLASQHGFWATAFWLYVGWNVSTLAGALAGDALGDVKTWGLDAIAAAAFLALLWPRLTSLEPVIVAIAAAAVTAVLFPVVPSGIPVLCAAVVGIVTGMYRHKVSPHAPEAGEVGAR